MHQRSSYTKPQYWAQTQNLNQYIPVKNYHHLALQQPNLVCISIPPAAKTEYI